MTARLNTLTRVVVAPIINYVGSDASKLVEVLKVRDIPNVLKCPKCGSDVRKERFALHLAEHVHSSGKPICDLCGAKLSGQRDVLVHVREHLAFAMWRHGMWIWYCTVCGREFTSKRSVLVHVLKAHEVEE